MINLRARHIRIQLLALLCNLRLILVMRKGRILRHRRLGVSRDVSLDRHGPLVLRVQARRVEVMRIVLWHAQIRPLLHLVEIRVYIYPFESPVLLKIQSLATSF